MDKDAYYRDRILWRAEKHNLFDKQCSKFSDLSENEASTIYAVASAILPFIVFWESKDRWTALGTRGISSKYDNKLVSSEIDTINKNLGLYKPKNADTADIKFKSEFIELKDTGILIWAPAGPALFALISILRMFPLRKDT